MPEIEASRLATLEEAEGRVPTLEGERDAATTRAEAAEARAATLIESANRSAVARVIREAADACTPPVTLDEYQVAGLSVDPPMSDDGTVNETALRTRADEAVAKIAKTHGAGTPRGFGAPASESGGGASAPTVDELAEARRAAFGRTAVKGA